MQSGCLVVINYPKTQMRLLISICQRCKKLVICPGWSPPSLYVSCSCTLWTWMRDKWEEKMDWWILSAISYFLFLSIFDLVVLVFYSRLTYGGSKRIQVIPVVDIKYPHASAYVYPTQFGNNKRVRKKKEGRLLTPIKVKSRAAKFRAFL